MKYLLIFLLCLSACGDQNPDPLQKEIHIAPLVGSPELAFASFAFDPNTEPDIAGYRLHWGTVSGVYTQHKNIGNITENTINGLVPGTEHFFSVTAYDTDRLESDYASEITYTPPNTPIVWETAQYDPDIHNETFSFAKDPEDGLVYFYTHFQWEGAPNVKYRVFRKMDLNEVAWEEIEVFNVYPSVSTPTVSRTFYMTYRYYPVPTAVFYKVSPIQ